jgi:hypothetical protein
MSVDNYQVGGGYYRDKDVQPWDAMKSWMTPEQFEGYLRGNVIKYLARYPEKGGGLDLLKARHYLEKLLEEVDSNVDEKPVRNVRKPTKKVKK